MRGSVIVCCLPGEGSVLGTQAAWRCGKNAATSGRWDGGEAPHHANVCDLARGLRRWVLPLPGDAGVGTWRALIKLCVDCGPQYYSDVFSARTSPHPRWVSRCLSLPIFGPFSF